MHFLKRSDIATHSFTCKLECGPMPNVMVALPNVGAEIASTGKHKYGKHKYECAGVENASTENASTNYILGMAHDNTTSIGN